MNYLAGDRVKLSKNNVVPVLDSYKNKLILKDYARTPPHFLRAQAILFSYHIVIVYLY